MLGALLAGPAASLDGSGASERPVHVDEELREASGPRSVIVSFDARPSPSTLDAIDRVGTVHHVYSVIDAVHARAPASELDTIAQLPDVTRIDADEELEWHLAESRPAVQVGPNLWDEGYRGADTTVAVVDTGIDSSHPSVQGRVVRCVVFPGNGDAVESDTCTDRDGHGTHVAGITGGNGGSSQLSDTEDRRYAGIAVETGLVSLDISQEFTTSTAIRAFEWVHDNHEQYEISVVQNSWGRKETGMAYDPDDPAIRASNTLVDRDGQVVVFSAGNEGPGTSTLTMEAMNPKVLTVAATDNSGEVAEFSGRGPVPMDDSSIASWTKPDVSAPGVRIKSAAAGEKKSSTSFYAALSGTSQAAPHVAGIAAMIQSETDLPPAAVMEAIESSARDLEDSGPDPATGHGMVLAPRALEIALQSNGTLGSNQETYTSDGRIVVGSGLSDLFPEDSGASSERANGSFPVKEDAETLTFSFTWTSAREDLPAPNLKVRLTDPQDRGVVVPADGQAASRTLDGPVAGSWSWEAVPASDTEAGAADYQSNATVELASQPAFAGDSDDAFDDSIPQQTQRAFQDAVDQFGPGPVIGAIALVVVLLLGAIVLLSRGG